LRGRTMGITDVDRIYTAEELARGDVMFAATGVTTGDFLRGVRFFGTGAETHSVVMRSRTGTVRYVQSIHRLDKKLKAYF
jgi:fructose-1,6-bisphosphatase II